MSSSNKIPKLDKAVDASSKPEGSSSVDLAPSPREDVTRLLEDLISDERYCGGVAGPKVCISNLGRTFDADQLRSDFLKHLTGVQSIQFSGCVVEGIPLHSGHGCITFDSVSNAIRGIIKLDKLYLDTPMSPIPRPILSAFPEEQLWSEEDIPGYIHDQSSSPHFCQANCFEYDLALEWSYQQHCHIKAKSRLCGVYEKRICVYLNEVKISNRGERTGSNRPSDRQARSIVCLGVSKELGIDRIRKAIEVVDRCGSICRLKCPVTGRGAGTVFIETSSAARAASLVEDFTRFLFIFSKSPRPALVNLVSFGPAPGFEGVFDRAMQSAFSTDSTAFETSIFSKTRIIDGSLDQSVKQKWAQHIRHILNDMMEKRASWKAVSLTHQKDLHSRQTDWLKREMKKLENLESVVPQFLSEEERRKLY